MERTLEIGMNSHDQHFLDRVNGTMQGMLQSVGFRYWKKVYNRDYEWYMRQLTLHKAGELKPERAEVMRDNFGWQWAETERYRGDGPGGWTDRLTDSSFKFVRYRFIDRVAKDPNYSYIRPIYELVHDYEHTMNLLAAGIDTLDKIRSLPVNILSLDAAYHGNYTGNNPELAHLTKVAHWLSEYHYYINEYGYSELGHAIRMASGDLLEKDCPNYNIFLDGYIFWWYGNASLFQELDLDDMWKYNFNSGTWVDVANDRLLRVADGNQIHAAVETMRSPYTSRDDFKKLVEIRSWYEENNLRLAPIYFMDPRGTRQALYSLSRDEVGQALIKIWTNTKNEIKASRNKDIMYRLKDIGENNRESNIPSSGKTQASNVSDRIKQAEGKGIFGIFNLFKR